MPAVELLQSQYPCYSVIYGAIQSLVFSVHDGECRCLCSQPDEEFHYRIIFIDISTSDEETDVLAIWNNSFLVYANFNVTEFTSELTEENSIDLNLEKIAPLDLFSVFNFGSLLVKAIILEGSLDLL